MPFTWTDDDTLTRKVGSKKRVYTLSQLEGGSLDGQWLLTACTPGGAVKGRRSPVYGSIAADDKAGALSWASGCVEAEWTDGTWGQDTEGLAAVVGCWPPVLHFTPGAEAGEIVLDVYEGVRVSKLDCSAPEFVAVEADVRGRKLGVACLPGWPHARSPMAVMTDEGNIMVTVAVSAEPGVTPTRIPMVDPRAADPDPATPATPATPAPATPDTPSASGDPADPATPATPADPA